MNMRSVRYIDRIMENVRQVKEEDIVDLYNDIHEADCIILVGEGRSQGALLIGMGQINKTVRLIEDVDFPGRNIIDAAPRLERMHRCIVVLVNSGSGETTIPKIVVKELSEYIEKTRSEKFKIHAVVSDPLSSVGRICEKPFGNVLVLKGRNLKETNDFASHGIMNDVYELGSMLIFQKIKEHIINQAPPEGIKEDILREGDVVRDIVHEFINSPMYENIISNLERRSHITIGGLGPARHVATMTAIRLQHVKRAIGDDAYPAGPFAPKPRAGDLLMLISWSGETLPLLEWCKIHKNVGAFVYSIVGNYSTLSEHSESFILNAPASVFYERAAFALSPLPIHLVERLKERGFELPDYIMRWFHSETE